MRIIFILLFTSFTLYLSSQEYRYKIANRFDDGHSCSQSFFIPSIEIDVIALGECFFNNNTETTASSIAVRFTNLNLSKNIIIDSAFIQFSAAGGNLITYPIVIHGELNHSSKPLDYIPLNIQKRNKTINNVQWMLSGKWSKNYRGDLLKTPDISTLINEVVNLEEWTENDHSIMFFFNNAIDTLPGQQIHFHGYGSDIFSLRTEHLPELVIYIHPDPPMLNDDDWAAVFPNPGGDDSYIFINLDIEAQICLDVYDASGRLLSKQSHHFSPGQHKIFIDDLFEYPSAVYFFKLKGDNLPLQNLTWVHIK